jgi:hypothetical protein
MRLRKGSPGKISVPILISRSVPFEPFKKPFFGFAQILVNGDRFFALKILCYGHLSQSFFVHRISSWLALVRAIIPQFQSQGNRCPDTKIDIKGNLCPDISG